MATTQDNRLLAVYTALGKDYLMINRFSAKEGLSQLFEFEVELVHEEDEAGFVSTAVDPSSVIGKPMTVSVDQRDGTLREFTGIVSEFSQGNRDTRFSYYYAKVVPHVWILTQTLNSRIFQHISVPDILKKIFNGFEVNWQIQGVTNRRNFCVQYRESDFDFASRLMEEEGIYYYFEHEGGKHKMVVANTPQSHPNCPSKSSIPYFIDVTRSAEDFITSITGWQEDARYQTGKVTLWDYNFQLPTKKLNAQTTSGFILGDNHKMEQYEFPAGYARKYDGIDRGGGEQSGELNHADSDDKNNTVSNLMQSLDAQVQVQTGTSDCSSLTSGYKFELTQHPVSEFNGQYVITTVTHEAEQNPTYVSDEYVEQPYQNSFTCIDFGRGAPPFRPARKTPKPVVQGSQTAFVVGPAGEEIFTDKYGRVKVQFHWDREGQADSTSSCWIRVAQGWASNKWGAMFIPRIGMEVLVHFLEGDPDQPIITGCVYNPQAMPPYTLPDEKTKSTVKSNTSKGGGGFNEFRFEDKAGREQVFLHAQKNQDIRVKSDRKELVMNDRHLIVKNDKFEKVEKDKHLKITGDHNEKVDGTISVKAGVDILEKAGNKFAVDAGMEIHLKSGMSMTLESGASLTLKVGGNFINVNSGGVFISGSLVMINSGGAAGSGSGSSPNSPQDAIEADNADPGNTPQPPPRQSPPPFPGYTSLTALTLSHAAETGAAFCET